MYYCNFTTRLYVQAAFNRDTVVTSYSDMHVGHVLCDNKRWSCIKKGFFFTYATFNIYSWYCMFTTIFIIYMSR